MAIDVDEFIGQELSGVVSLDEVPAILEAIGQRVIVNAALAETATDIVGASEVAGVVAAIVGSIGVLPIILILLGLVILAGFLDNILSTTVARIPWVGGALASFIHLSFDPIRNLENWIGNKAGDIVNHLWTDLTHSIGYFAGQHAISNPVSSQVPSAAQVKVLQNEINTTNSHVAALNTSYEQLYRYVHNQPTSALPQGVLTLPEQLYKVEQDVQTLYSNQTNFYQELQSITHNLTSLRDDVQQLEKSVVGVRTVEVGFQDIVQHINDVLDQSRKLENDLDNRVDHNTRSIAELQPLNLLLEPGIAGLRNLRKLEDNICQCPKLSGIGNELGTALALLEFAENG